MTSSAASGDTLGATWDNMNTPGNIGTPGFYTVGSEVEIGSPLIAYSQNSATINDQIYYSLYRGTEWTARAYAVTYPDAGDWDQHFKVARTNPVRTKQAVVWKNGNLSFRDDLMVAVWDGTNWDNGTGSPYGDAQDLGRTVDGDYRTFDAAFEQVSGDL